MVASAVRLAILTAVSIFALSACSKGSQSTTTTADAAIALQEIDHTSAANLVPKS